MIALYCKKDLRFTNSQVFLLFCYSSELLDEADETGSASIETF